MGQTDFTGHGVGATIYERPNNSIDFGGIKQVNQN